MRKFAVILLGLASALLTGATQITKVGKVVLAQTGQNEGYAFCSFYTNVNLPPESKAIVS